MKKGYKYTELSDRECSIAGCNKKIKARVLTLQPDANLCFCHYMELERNNPRYKNGKKLPAFKRPEQEMPEPQEGKVKA